MIHLGVGMILSGVEMIQPGVEDEQLDLLHELIILQAINKLLRRLSRGQIRSKQTAHSSDTETKVLELNILHAFR